MNAAAGDIVVFRDPHPKSPKRDGFNQVAIVVNGEMAVFIRAGKVLTLSVNEILQAPSAAVLRPNVPGLSDKIAEFFRRNTHRPRILMAGFVALELSNYRVFDRPDLMPVLERPLSPAEHQAAWVRVTSQLQDGDGVFVFEHNSVVDWLISRIDHGSWSHVATYIGNGQLVESIPWSGVVNRGIAVYRSRLVRLGIYRRFGLDPQEVSKLLHRMAAQVGGRYGMCGALRLGVKKLIARVCLGNRPVVCGPDPWSEMTPNDIIYSGTVFLVDYV